MVRKVRIKIDQLSDLIWENIFALNQSDIESVLTNIREMNKRLEANRPKMLNNTGTISLMSGLCLYFTTRMRVPKTVFEIGTFIGRSAGAIAMAMDDNQTSDGNIFTCDESNDFLMDTSFFETKITPMPSTTSTDALRSLSSSNTSIDLVHIDGRLQADDLDLLAKVSHENTLIALDDFMNLRKGVANALLLRNLKPFDNHILMTPPDKEFARSLGVFDISYTGLLVPRSLVSITT